MQPALAVLRAVPATAWDDKAGSLEWTRWESVEHLADDLFFDAVQNSVHAAREAGPAGLLQVLEACGALLVAMVRTTSPQVRAHHVFGASDPEGFAAMGVVETLAHTHDVAEGLGLAWSPPAEICTRVLARLFPDAPTGTEPWPTLLWATGRAELGDRPRRTTWRWNGAPGS